MTKSKLPDQKAVECYHDLCKILDKYDGLNGSQYLSAIIEAMYYVYPILDMTPKFIGEQVIELVDRWKAKQATSEAFSSFSSTQGSNQE